LHLARVQKKHQAECNNKKACIKKEEKLQANLISFDKEATDRTTEKLKFSGNSI
jgi:hypothetical protein